MCALAQRLDYCPRGRALLQSWWRAARGRGRILLACTLYLLCSYSVRAVILLRLPCIFLEARLQCFSLVGGFMRGSVVDFMGLWGIGASKQPRAMWKPILILLSTCPA